MTFLTKSSAQLDLFPPPPAPDFDWAQREGWERRALSDMAERPLVCCFPGFMGAVCERLVAKGLATKEPAGFLPPPDLPPKKLKQMRWRSEDYPQFRYSLADARASASPPSSEEDGPGMPSPPNLKA